MWSSGFTGVVGVVGVVGVPGVEGVSLLTSAEEEPEEASPELSSEEVSSEEEGAELEGAEEEGAEEDCSSLPEELMSEEEGMVEAVGLDGGSFLQETTLTTNKSASKTAQSFFTFIPPYKN